MSVSLFSQENNVDYPENSLSASFFGVELVSTSSHFALSTMSSKLRGSKATTATAKKTFAKGIGPSKL